MAGDLDKYLCSGGKFQLACNKCGLKFQDDFNFTCPKGCQSLISTIYPVRSPLAESKQKGIWRYSGWLPVQTGNDYEVLPQFFFSKELSLRTGQEIYIAFHGYFPEIGANYLTCNFKELEAVVSLRYAAERNTGITLASVGNAASAFASFAYLENIDIFIFIPEKVYHDLTVHQKSDNVKLVMVKGSYEDAQFFARQFAELRGLVYEGGGKNIARRDSLSLLPYLFYEKFGFLPDAYFQAIGSGTGAIAFYEGVQRMLGTGVKGKCPKVIVVQNEPFTPVRDAWTTKKREIDKFQGDPLEHVYAKVLSNRVPLYSLAGGLFDVLSDSKGYALAVTTDEARNAGELFEDIYGIDLHPAAEVALAALLQSKESGRILLNITGAGHKRLRQELKLIVPAPNFIVENPSDLERIR